MLKIKKPSQFCEGFCDLAGILRPAFKTALNNANLLFFKYLHILIMQNKEVESIIKQ